MSRKLRSLLRLGPAYRYSEGKSGQSYYRRTLPAQLITLDSPEGKLIFREALQEGHCESFFTLAQQFITQNQVSTCSSATLAMILNSLKVDPGVNWKGIWRWYDDYNIKHMHPSKIGEGLTLQEYNALAKLNSARSLAFSPLEPSEVAAPASIRKSSLAFFRNCLIACNRRSDTFLTVNFNRKALGQTGTGHYSPVAGYNAKRDLALILDVAKFKYDSYWCPLGDLYEALKPLDKVSLVSRGFVMNKKGFDTQPGSSNFNAAVGEITAEKGEIVKEKGEITVEKGKSNADKDLNIIEKAVKLINKTSMHSSLVPILYEFATSQIPNFQHIIVKMSNQLITSGLLLETCQSPNTFNEQGRILLQAFKKDEMSDIFRLLLVLTHLQENPNAVNQFKWLQSEVSWNKCRLLVLDMLFELQKGRRET